MSTLNGRGADTVLTGCNLSEDASLPRMVEIVEPLRALLEEGMQGTPKMTTRVKRNRDLPDNAWTDDRVLALKAAQDLVAHAVTLNHPRPDFEVLIFPDARRNALGAVGIEHISNYVSSMVLYLITL